MLVQNFLCILTVLLCWTVAICEASVPFSRITSGVDCPRNTLSSQPSGSPHDCASWCATVKECFGFVFVLGNPPVCYLKNAVLPNGPADENYGCYMMDSPEQSAYSQVTHGVDCPGFTFGYSSSSSGLSMDECAGNCEHSSGCVGFAMDGAEDTAQTCWLKSAIVPNNTAASQECFLMNAAADSLFTRLTSGVDCSGNEVGINTGYSSTEACAQWCLTVPACVGFAFDASAGKCSLKRAVVATEPSRSVSCFLMKTNWMGDPQVHDKIPALLAPNTEAASVAVVAGVWAVVILVLVLVYFCYWIKKPRETTRVGQAPTAYHAI